MTTNNTCSIDGCTRCIFGRGWCQLHYSRWYRNGDPLAGADTRAPPGEPEHFFQTVVVAFDGDDCLLWPYDKSGDGYGRLRRGKRHERVARLACEARNGPPPSAKHEAAHNCGKGHLACCNPKHLRWATHLENMADRKMHGTLAAGTRNGRAKINESDVAKIRALQGTISQQKIAEMFGVSQAQINRILLGTNWKKSA